MYTKKMKEIFSKYRIFKLWITNINNINENVCQNIDINKSKSYVTLIENILSYMDKDESEIIRFYYIDKSKKEKFQYSNSGFYWKLRKASMNFLKYFEV